MNFGKQYLSEYRWHSVVVLFFTSLYGFSPSTLQYGYSETLATALQSCVPGKIEQVRLMIQNY